MSKDWFKNWFDTEFYHHLYQNRNEEEARLFLDVLVRRIGLEQGSKVCDLACGKGRHSIFLAEKGFDVTGLDLSSNSIQLASASANEHLRFRVQDMREPFGDNEFDVVFNLFTSFGYFENGEDNTRVMNNVFRSLKPGGLFVQDYYNAGIFKPFEEQKHIHGRWYHTRKWLDGNWIRKEIKVIASEGDFTFHEQIRAFSLQELQELHSAAGLQTEAVFGNYLLMHFEPAESDRMILVSRKPEHA